MQAIREGIRELTLLDVVVERGARQEHTLRDPEGGNRAVQLTVRPSLEALTLVDDEAVPPIYLAEDARVAGDGLVSREDNVRLERTARVKELVVLDNLARLAIALRVWAGGGEHSSERSRAEGGMTAHVVRHDAHAGRPLGELAHPCVRPRSVYELSTTATENAHSCR